MASERDFHVGATVHCQDGACGQVINLVAGEGGEAVQKIVVGGLSGDKSAVAVPVDKVRGAQGQNVYLDLDKADLNDFLAYGSSLAKASQPSGSDESGKRPDQEILDDVRRALKKAAYDLKGVDASIENGVVRLTGSTHDVSAKRRAESTARSVEGVADVENALTTATATSARITAALADDPRTEKAAISVAAEQGTATLEGKVDNQEIKDAAEEIARAQPGVVEVINDLEAEKDEDTTFIRLRLADTGSSNPI